MTMNKKSRYNGGGGRGGFYRDVFGPGGALGDEYECSVSSGRIDTEVSVSEGSSAPKRKCISLNSSSSRDNFGVPMQVLPLSSMLSSERKGMVSRLRTELEQIQVLKKRVEMHRTNGVTVSSSSDIVSCSNGPNRLLQSSSTGQGKKQYPAAAQKAMDLNRGNAGRFKSVGQTEPSAGSAMLMKQCETLLKRLMSLKSAPAFLEPVDIVKLNIPDYFTIIKHPMDLGTVKKKLSSGRYLSPLEFAADVRLTFANAMTYNPPANIVYSWADELSKYFEVRWKAIEKKLPKSEPPPKPKSRPHETVETAPKPVLPSRKRTITSVEHEVKSVPVKRVMSMEEKDNLRRDLESLPAEEMPLNIIDFLREHSSNGKDNPEDEIEVDINVLSDDTLFTLRNLLDKCVKHKENNDVRAADPCSVELVNESGLSNSTMQPCEVNDFDEEDVDIGGNDPPVTSYPPIVIEKDTDHKTSKNISPCSSAGSDSSSSESDSDDDDDSKALSPVPQPFISEAQVEEKTTCGNPLEGNQSDSGLDQVEQTSHPKPSSVESDSRQDGDSAPTERPISPDKQYRAALLKNRFADTILRAREKTLHQGYKEDPEKLRRQREELELQQKKDKARLLAEAKAAEEAKRKKEAEDAAEAKRKRELEREAARQKILEVEKTVEINNTQFSQEWQMLATAPVESTPCLVDEASPDYSDNGLVGFRFGSGNALERLGLSLKQDFDDEEEEEEEEDEADPVASNPVVDDMEEGEID